MVSLWSIFLIFFIIILLGSAWWYLTIPSNLPPGPIGLPFVGSMFNTWRASDLHRKLHSWTKLYGPIYKFYVADKLILILGDFDTIQEALVKQGDVWAGRPRIFTDSQEFAPGTGLVNSEGELWKVQRRFALSTLRDFGFGRPIIEPQIKEETEYLIEALDLQKSKSFDPAPFLNNSVSNVICAMVFGRRFEYEDKKFHELLSLIRARLTESDVSSLTPFVLSPVVSKLMSRVPKVQEFIRQSGDIARFIDREIAKTVEGFDPANDEPTNYIQAFYKAAEKESNWTFTNDHLLTSVSNLFIAGTDTTATTLRWAIFYLCHNPEWQDKIFQEIRAQVGDQRSHFKYADRTKLPITEAVIMESQRMADLVPIGVRRRNMVKTKLCGYDIPEDTVAIPLLTAVLRDPKVYPNPDKFDPNRFLQKNGEKSAEMTHLIPFQLGKRICLGESLARMELVLFFMALFSTFKFKFSPDEPVPSIDDEKVSLIRAPPRFKVQAINRSEYID